MVAVQGKEVVVEEEEEEIEECGKFSLHMLHPLLTEHSYLAQDTPEQVPWYVCASCPEADQYICLPCVLQHPHNKVRYGLCFDSFTTTFCTSQFLILHLQSLIPPTSFREQGC